MARRYGAAAAAHRRTSGAHCIPRGMVSPQYEAYGILDQQQGIPRAQARCSYQESRTSMVFLPGFPHTRNPAHAWCSYHAGPALSAHAAGARRAAPASSQRPVAPVEARVASAHHASEGFDRRLVCRRFV
jgi:hypothetical protein